MKDLFETLSNRTRMQSDLINAGIPSEQATAIAFNCEKESLIQVEQDMLNTMLRMAFTYGGQQEFRTNKGTATLSEMEAMDKCVREINNLLRK